MSDTRFARAITGTGQLLHGSFAEPTSGLRFVLRDGARILQQEWRLTEYHNGEAVSGDNEWRDVPLTEEVKQ